MQVNFLSTTIAIMIGLWVMTTFVTISTFPVAYILQLSEFSFELVAAAYKSLIN